MEKLTIVCGGCGNTSGFSYSVVGEISQGNQSVIIQCGRCEEVTHLGEIMKEGDYSPPRARYSPLSNPDMDNFENIWSLKLVDAGKSKLNVVKIVKDQTGLGLRESKTIVDECGVVKSNMTKIQAEDLGSLLKEFGVRYEIYTRK